MSQISAEAINVSVVRRWKRYAAYKDSGVEWLRKIPVHWEVKRIKYLAEILRGKFTHRPRNDPRLYDGVYPFIQTGDIAAADKYITGYQQTLNNLGFAVSKEFPAMTLIMAIAANIGDIAILNFPACFPDSIVGFISRVNVLLDYLYYNLVAMRQEMIGTATLNTQLNLNIERIGSLLSVCPPIVEQQAIASFLDRETAKIDTLIAKKEQLIRLLQEKRTTMKDSGVELLGEIPTHWEMKRLKYGYEICLGKMLQPQPSSPLDTLEPYLRSANIAWEEIDISNVKEMWFSPYEKSLYELKYGDLIISEGGDVGRSAIWKSELSKCYIQNAVHRVGNKEGYSNKFLYYWMFFLKAVGYIDLLCNKATIAHFTVEKVKEIPVTHPVFPEQQAIASFLDRETAKIDSLIAKIRTGIEQMKEYRTALISSAVTGKIDVSEEAAAA